MRRPAAVIFDFDDTLIATSTSRKLLFLRFLQLFTDVTPDSLERVWGRPMLEMLQRLAPNVDPDRALDAYRAIMEFGPPAPLLPGVEAAIRELSDEGVALMILTSSARRLVESDLARHNLLPMFTLIWSSDEMLYAKPDPRVLSPLMAWLRDNGQRLDNILYVGDSPTDYELAARTGIPFVAVTTGSTDEGRFRSLGALQIASSLYAIPQLIAQQA